MKRTKEFLKYLNDTKTERVRNKIVTEKGKVIDILVQYETFLEGKWVVIIRYDCAHGFFHKDVIYPDGSKEKHEVVIETLRHAVSYAQQDIKDRWKWYRDRYIKKIKKT